MTHIELFRAYLRHYADKNLEAISALLAEEVHLRDWNISVHFGRVESDHCFFGGKENVHRLNAG